MNKTNTSIALGAAAVMALAGYSVYDSLFRPLDAYQTASYKHAAPQTARTASAPQNVEPELEIETEAPVPAAQIKKRTPEELMALLETAENPKELRQAAVDIQNLHSPELLGPVIAQLEKRGLLENARFLPWFSGRLLSEHIKKADEEELIRALRVVELRPHLAQATADAVSERLAGADPSIRRILAKKGG